MSIPLLAELAEEGNITKKTAVIPTTGNCIFLTLAIAGNSLSKGD